MSLVSRLLVAFQVCNTPMSMCVWVLMNGIDTDTGARSQTGAGSLSPSRRHSHFECLPSPLPGSDANHCRVNNRCSVALALTLPHPHTDRPRDSRRPSQLCRWLQNFISFWPGKLPISFRSEDFSKCVMHACVCMCMSVPFGVFSSNSASQSNRSHTREAFARYLLSDSGPSVSGRRQKANWCCR